MKKGVWVGSLVLSLGGWAMPLLAQDADLQPKESGPIPVNLAPNELKSCPIATIGHPIPVADDPVSDNAPSASAPSVGVKQATFKPANLPLGFAPPTALEIPGGDELATPSAVDPVPKKPMLLPAPLPAPLLGAKQAIYQSPRNPPGVAAPTAQEIPGGEELPTWADVEAGSKERAGAGRKNSTDHGSLPRLPGNKTAPVNGISATTAPAREIVPAQSVTPVQHAVPAHLVGPPLSVVTEPNIEPALKTVPVPITPVQYAVPAHQVGPTLSVVTNPNIEPALKTVPVPCVTPVQYAVPAHQVGPTLSVVAGPDIEQALWAATAPGVVPVSASAQARADGVPPAPSIRPPTTEPIKTNPDSATAGTATPTSAPYDHDAKELSPPYSHFYAGADYLLWWIKKDSQPPLATSSTDTTSSSAGALGQSATNVLIGGPYGMGAFSGIRATAGYWLNNWREEAIEVSGFYLGQRSVSTTAVAGANAVLARPFFDVDNNVEAAAVVASPGVMTGAVNVTARSEFGGLDTNFRWNIAQSGNYRVDMLFGFRYANLKESLDIDQTSQGSSSNVLATVNDQFETSNQFYGGQIGLSSACKRGPWSLDLSTKFAIGGVNQQINIAGNQTVVASNGVSSSYNGGLLALPSNIGQQSQTHFSFIPELSVTVGYQLTDWARLYAGYNFMYWTEVVRPGQQIDRNLDITQIPNFNTAGAVSTGQKAPGVPFQQSDFWAQGLVVGFEIRY